MKISDLKDSDVGRLVVYTAHHGETEEGTISSWNDKFVFVRYTSGPNGTATDPDQLEFSLP